MNESILQGKWEQLKGEVRQTWGKLTDDDLARVKGSTEKLTGMLRERYGWTQEEATKRVADFVEKLEERYQQPVASVR